MRCLERRWPRNRHWVREVTGRSGHAKESPQGGRLAQSTGFSESRCAPREEEGGCSPSGASAGPQALMVSMQHGARPAPLWGTDRARSERGRKSESLPWALWAEGKLPRPWGEAPRPAGAVSRPGTGCGAGGGLGVGGRALGHLTPGLGVLIRGRLVAEPSLPSAVRPGLGRSVRAAAAGPWEGGSPAPFSALTRARLWTGPEEGGPSCSQGPRAAAASTLGRRAGVSYSPGAAGIRGRELGW